LNLGWDESVAEDNKFANTDSVRLENERDRGKNWNYILFELNGIFYFRNKSPIEKCYSKLIERQI
jgi:hypothetical protein